jgi:hypothetical protein
LPRPLRVGRNRFIAPFGDAAREVDAVIGWRNKAIAPHDALERIAPQRAAVETVEKYKHCHGRFA